MERSDKPCSDSNLLAFLLGGGEMGGLIRSMDWVRDFAGTGGRVAGWPQSLRTTVSISLASDLPICVIWGSGLVQLYNDAYRVNCGNKHPRSMRRTSRNAGRRHGRSSGRRMTRPWPATPPSTGLTGAIIGMRSFGLSAPGAVAATHFGFEPADVVAAAKEQITRQLPTRV